MLMVDRAEYKRKQAAPVLRLRRKGGGGLRERAKGAHSCPSNLKLGILDLNAHAMHNHTDTLPRARCNNMHVMP